MKKKDISSRLKTATKFSKSIFCLFDDVEVVAAKFVVAKVAAAVVDVNFDASSLKWIIFKLFDLL